MEMNRGKIYHCIDALLDYAKRNLDLPKKNVDYARNGIFRLFGLDAYPGEQRDTDVSDETPERLLDELTEACIAEGLFEPQDAEFYRDSVMGELMLSPQEVQTRFVTKLEDMGSGAALQWFYAYCVKSDYVKKAVLDKNPRFPSQGLIVTINKAKPEFRDPKKAVSGNSTKTGYPKCNICHENEGFAGRNKRTLRTIDITLGGKPWFWQYSPYGYFREHGIAVNYEHIPMHTDRATFTRLMDFVDLFPTYFIGCNAPLERIGGSVLAHDHYQGGGEILPMHRAGAAYTLRSGEFPEAVVEVLDWAGTVVRVVSNVRADIEEIGERIREKWVSYENRALGIVPEDEKGVHNAISPTVVKTTRGYEMSIILRSNLTSEQYPDGIFHAHPEFHIIKKESIGLIEAQGLFILPGRLEKQLGELEALIVAGKPLTEELCEFSLVYEEVKARVGHTPDMGSVKNAMREELGSICNRILENTAVFKDKRQTVAFMQELGFEI